MSEFYKPEEIDECPSCGSKNRNIIYPSCWHCNDCGFAVCAYFKHEIDEIRIKKEIENLISKLE